MSFKFQFLLRFSGLCAFVRNTNGKRATVLLVDTNAAPSGNGQNGNGHNGNGHLVSGGNGHLIHEPHAPVFGFDLRDMAASNLRAPDETFSNGQPLGLCSLVRQDLIFPAQEMNKLTIRSGRIEERPDQPGVDLESCNWLAGIDQVQDGLGLTKDLSEIDPACFADQNVHPAVAARIRLTQGLLRTHQLSTTEAGWVRCNFTTPNGARGPFNRPIAVSMEWVFDVMEDELLIEFKDFDDPLHSEPLVLAPRSGEKRVVAWIKNAPVEDIRRQRDAECFITGITRPRDNHFDHYYRLSKSSLDSGHGPVPFPSSVHPFPGGDLPGSTCADCPCSEGKPNGNG